MERIKGRKEEQEERDKEEEEEEYGSWWFLWDIDQMLSIIFFILHFHSALAYGGGDSDHTQRVCDAHDV